MAGCLKTIPVLLENMQFRNVVLKGISSLFCTCVSGISNALLFQILTCVLARQMNTGVVSSILLRLDVVHFASAPADSRLMGDTRVHILS